MTDPNYMLVPIKEYHLTAGDFARALKRIEELESENRIAKSIQNACECGVKSILLDKRFVPQEELFKVRTELEAVKGELAQRNCVSMEWHESVIKSLTSKLKTAAEALEKYKDIVWISGGRYTPAEMYAARTALASIKETP